MSNYVQSTNFATKDSLPSGDPLKIVKGTEINTEFANIAIAVATKADLASPTFTGTPAAPTASAGTSTTQVATTAFVQQEITAHTVSTAQIEDSAVTTAKIANSAVTTTKIADANVTTAKIVDANITTAKIADANVTTAKIADANVTPAKLSQPLTLGTSVASTSGTSVNFTSIPSWVKRITVMFNGVSTSGTSTPIIQLGDSGGVETTGYLGSATICSGSSTFNNNFTTGFGCGGIQAANDLRGAIVLSLLDSSSNTWVASGTIGASSSAFTVLTGGTKSTSAVLDRIRVTTVDGTDTFDAGSINILYE